jgi:hypothetical protein
MVESHGKAPQIGSRAIWLILAAGSAALLLSLTGFCFTRLRYLPDRELFERGIAHQSYRIGDYAPSDTPASYLEKHPNCCSIPVFQPANSFLNILLGQRLRYVRVVYRMPQEKIDKNPRAGEFYEAFVETTPCGTTFHAIGTSIAEMN